MNEREKHRGVCARAFAEAHYAGRADEDSVEKSRFIFLCPLFTHWCLLGLENLYWRRTSQSYKCLSELTAVTQRHTENGDKQV